MQIYEYTDYRQFLVNFVEEQKKTLRNKFSVRQFATRAGLASSGHLSLVMTGKRNLTLESARKFAKGLKLKGKESLYFEKMVEFNNSTEPAEKLKIYSQLEKIRFQFLTRNLDFKESTGFYKHWYYPLVYELCGHTGFQTDGEWISNTLCKIITPTQAEEALNSLITMGYLQTDENKKLRRKDVLLQSIDEIEQLQIRQFNQKMITLALDHINDPIKDRELGGVTVLTSEEKFNELKKMIKNFIQETNSMSSVSDGETLVQLNVQMFKLTKN